MDWIPLAHGWFWWVRELTFGFRKWCRNILHIPTMFFPRRHVFHEWVSEWVSESVSQSVSQSLLSEFTFADLPSHQPVLINKSLSARPLSLLVTTNVCRSVSRIKVATTSQWPSNHYDSWCNYPSDKQDGNKNPNWLCVHIISLVAKIT
jgi:hypothetical protein